MQGTCCCLGEKIKIKLLFKKSIKSCTNMSYNANVSNIRILTMHKLSVAIYFSFIYLFIFIRKREFNLE